MSGRAHGHTANTDCTMIKNVIKRDGRVVEFDKKKIIDAITKAMDVTEAGEDIVLAAEIAARISRTVWKWS